MNLAQAIVIHALILIQTYVQVAQKVINLPMVPVKNVQKLVVLLALLLQQLAQHVYHVLFQLQLPMYAMDAQKIMDCIA